ncbi:hypothetical protein BT96DRAFT_1070865 [Gymnopus androsaceus JB14]|uniref:Uncharacterized protein n=1 Tax=Gymnopus androsaceus JB14 TaxID=1447944 RepID=A0A6A4GU36_9AGAR|nr:hypothetical protein BT96DRAFT_1070865 [Gymnopus androsaceus JB14]
MPSMEEVRKAEESKKDKHLQQGRRRSLVSSSVCTSTAGLTFHYSPTFFSLPMKFFEEIEGEYDAAGIKEIRWMFGAMLLQGNFERSLRISHNATEYDNQIEAEMYVPAFWPSSPTCPSVASTLAAVPPLLPLGAIDLPTTHPHTPIPALLLYLGFKSAIAWNSHIFSSGSRNWMVHHHDIHDAHSSSTRDTNRKSVVSVFKWSSDRGPVSASLASRSNNNKVQMCGGGVTKCREASGGNYIKEEGEEEVEEDECFGFT